MSRLLLLLLAASALSACGKQGVLERPPPLFGERAKADYEAWKARGGADSPDETSREEQQDEDRDAPVPDPSEPLEPGNRPGSPSPEPVPVPRRPG
jgi:predicted small lipoprotein YifL